MADEPIRIAPKSRKKVSITVGELADALCKYFEAANGMKTDLWAFSDDRELRSTTFEFYGDMDQRLGRRRQIKTVLYGVAARSENARLGGEPIILTFSGDFDFKLEIVAVPDVDRSITFHKVKRREGGTFYY